MRIRLVSSSKPDEKDQKDADRCQLLKDYLLRNGFVIRQRVPEDQEPFVIDADFYGLTFDEAVESRPPFEHIQDVNALWND